MSSRIEQLIDEIEDYIESCKPKFMSSTEIIVNKDEIDELLRELRMKTPDEIKRYQKIISNKEAILADAQAKADQIIAQAQIQTNELVSEHQIMQQAYAQANEVVQIATKQAQEILDSATNEANNLRMSAMAYTDSQLKSIEDILTGSIETSKARYDSLISSLQQFEDVVAANRAELFPPEENGDEAAGAESSDNEATSDTSDDDIEITDETAESGDCLYVFTYVGVITCGSRVIKVYPKYLLSKKDDDVLDEMKQVVKVLERYSRSEEQIINVFNGDGENRSFNILAVILFLINDYYEYGIYTNSEDIIEVNGEGEILWGKTIDESFALIEDNRPYYMELYTEKSVEDDMDYFKRLHECVLTECSRQLHAAQLDELFDMDRIELSEETLEDFGDKEYILERIIKELNLQFNTHRQILLKTLYAYISQDRKMLDENDGISMFGTTAYHAVWEKAQNDSTACREISGQEGKTPEAD